MKSKDILSSYLAFFGKYGHKQVPNVSLVPQNDSTLLYVNSGMFPLVPYLSGEPHPLGKRIMNAQRCLRFFEDLENIGTTNRHTTAFHMLGNWSLGDYFKKEQLNWIYSFFIEELKLDPQKMYATVFEGDKDAPKDTESISIIQEIFSRYGIDAKEGERIFPYPKKSNWWQRGEAIGELGGPDSEIFYYIGTEGTGLGKDPDAFQDEFLEIGNSVFMQYQRDISGWVELPQKNVDFGGGLERMALVVQKKNDIYETDNFFPIIEKLQELSRKIYLSEDAITKAMRVLADHMRSATFLAMDGVIPGNKDQGYILRRLLRRMVRAGRELGVEKDISVVLVPVVADMLEWIYPDLKTTKAEIQQLFSLEEEKFRITLNKGTKEVGKKLEVIKDFATKGDLKSIAGIGFNIYQSLGYPFEMFFADLVDYQVLLDEKKTEEYFNENFSDHQINSRAGAEQKFKGGLADNSEKTIKYHTATHLLHMALRQTLGDQIVQHGSNITGERMRFDFNHPTKLTTDELAKVQGIINQTVKSAYPVNFVFLPKEDALKTGAIHAFNEKYPDEVKVYYIGHAMENALSKEFCGGPHVENTSVIGEIELYKQEKIGENLMRIYARFR